MVHLHTFRPAGAGDQRRPICFFSSFMFTVHWPCLLCSGTRRRSHVLKDNDWRDVTRNFGMGELRWVWGTCSCFGQLQGRGAWFGELLKVDPQTPWPNNGKASACFFPSTACCLVLKLRCEASMHTVSTQKFFAEQKKMRQASISKPRPISSYNLHGSDR